MKKLLLILLGALAAGDALGAATQQYCSDLSGVWTYAPQSANPGTFSLTQASNGSLSGLYHGYCPASGSFPGGYFTWIVDSTDTLNEGSGVWEIFLDKLGGGTPSECDPPGPFNWYVPLGTPGCAAGTGDPAHPFPALFLQVGGLDEGESAPYCAVPSSESDGTPSWQGGGTGIGKFPTTLGVPNTSAYFDSSYSFAGRRVQVVQSIGTTTDDCYPAIQASVPSPSATDYIATSDDNGVTVLEGWSEQSSATPVNNVGQVRRHTWPDVFPCNATVNEQVQIDCLTSATSGGTTWYTYETPSVGLTVNGTWQADLLHPGVNNTVAIARQSQTLPVAVYGAPQYWWQGLLSEFWF